MNPSKAATPLKNTDFKRRTVPAINAGGAAWCLALEANQDSLLSDALACFGTLKHGHPNAFAQDAVHERT